MGSLRLPGEIQLSTSAEYDPRAPTPNCYELRVERVGAFSA